jgi:hypothetical protein
MASTAPAAEMVWPTADLFDVTGILRGVLAEHGIGRQILHLVVFRRRGAVGVDVIDLSRLHSGIGQGLQHAADRGLAVGRERVRWKESVSSPQPATTPRIFAPRAIAAS